MDTADSSARPLLWYHHNFKRRITSLSSFIDRKLCRLLGLKPGQYLENIAVPSSDSELKEINENRLHEENQIRNLIQSLLLTVFVGFLVVLFYGDLVQAFDFFLVFCFEFCLSLDTMFVFNMVFVSMNVEPGLKQKKILTFGMGFAICVRIVLIITGAWLIEKFTFILPGLSLMLCVMGIRQIHHLYKEGKFKRQTNHCNEDTVTSRLVSRRKDTIKRSILSTTISFSTNSKEELNEYVADKDCEGDESDDSVSKTKHAGSQSNGNQWIIKYTSYIFPMSKKRYI